MQWEIRTRTVKIARYRYTYTSKVAAREKNATRAVVTLKTWLLGTISRYKQKLTGNDSAPSPKCGATVFTLTFSAPIKQTPVFSYRLTPHSLGHKLQLLKCAYAWDRFFEASIELMEW